MDYKSLLVNSIAYSRISKAKELLSRRFGSTQSFSDVINETFGKSMELLDIDDDLRAYIKTIADTLGKDGRVLGVLLFGSLVRGSYNQYSDIDLLIVVDEGTDKFKMIEELTTLSSKFEPTEMSLFGKQLPSSISPLIVHPNDLKEFEPIHLDFLDYGIVLYDYMNTLADFLGRMAGIKHKREFRRYGEVLIWQKEAR